MLTTIREKAQGAFAWVILLAIGIPFALWGIQNYFDAGKLAPVASVGDKDFYQNDVNRAYEQYAQQLRGMGIDEATLKAQALDKLIKDEVLLQYAHATGLVATDQEARDFIKELDYFKVDGKFNEDRYKSLLNSQRMTSNDFVARIKNALIMQQLQGGVTDTSFATSYDVESFFKIQNQQRDFDYVTVALPKLTEQPSNEEINAYYQQHQDQYKTPEQISVSYVELSLDAIAQKVEVTDDKLKAYYAEQKEQYSTPERRKISHILFAVNAQTDDKTALAKAQKAKAELASRDFAALAAEVSDDKLTAKNGGDLGLFNAGAMDKSFEEAVGKLKLGEVSEPVKSSFGYHLIKVTELVSGETKPFESVKAEVTKAYQKSQAETAFYDSGEKLAELSYENPDNLDAVAKALGLAVNKTAFFTKAAGTGIAANPKIREAAFSDEVLQGNNSTPVEISAEHVVVLRKLDYKPAAIEALDSVKAGISAQLLIEKAKKQALEKAQKLKDALRAGETLANLAANEKLEVKKMTGYTRGKTEISDALSDAVFKAAKPAGGKPTILVAELPDGAQAVVSLSKVAPGVISEDDKKKMDLATKNIAKAFGQAEFNAMLQTLETDADIEINKSADEAKTQ
ncbi:SurA N-terminal domain-containing protein [Methylomicrobium sp. Wu6]|uniref:SurA N-terminal domain-containing protein n=1 Tax=Methylomicrobium sp. Wu6 TaxID=3107928 RepID=UPI002DD61EC0|nr:SurA N-terminal domain-containing protein [Methylomicrobium sp. Wu6]MEC4749914.1 SurA N-terminal domain-containing protein [Methylomicrobium sp. Wu6]